MSNNQLINPDGTMRRTARPNPPPPPPPYCPPQPYNSNSPVLPLKMSHSANQSRMLNGNYSHVVQQSVQHQISIDTTLLHHSPQPTPPPPVLKPQAAPFPPPPTENLGTLVPASIYNEQEKKQHMIVENDGTLEERLCDDAVEHYKALGQIVRVMSFSLKDKSGKLESSDKINDELRAKIEVKSAQIHDLEENVKRLNNHIEEIESKATSEVQQSKREEAIWRNNYIKLNEDATAIKNESVGDKKTIESLKATVSDGENKLEELHVKLFTYELSENQYKKELEEKDIEIDLLKKKVLDIEKQMKEQQVQALNLVTSEKKFKEQLDVKEKEHKKISERFSKMTECFQKISAINKDMKTKMKELSKKDKENQEIVENLEMQKNNLKKSVDEMEATISKSSDENARIAKELEEERKETQNKVAELTKKTKIICDLQAEVKNLQKEKIALPKKFDAFMSEFWNSALSPKPPVSRSSSPESSSSCIPVGNVRKSTDEQEEEDDLSQSQAACVGQKRKIPAKNGDTEKKKRASTDKDQLQRKVVIILPRASIQGSNTDAEIPEVSSSSRISTTPSSRGTHQQNKKIGKQ